MEIINGLGQLYDPLKVNPEIDISDFDDQKLYILLRNMCCIRIAERKLAWAKEHRMITGPVHLGVGQEAASVGVADNLLSSDYLFGAHRSHAQILALKLDLRALFAEVTGKNRLFKRNGGLNALMA